LTRPLHFVRLLAAAFGTLLKYLTAHCYLQLVRPHLPDATFLLHFLEEIDTLWGGVKADHICPFFGWGDVSTWRESPQAVQRIWVLV